MAQQIKSLSNLDIRNTTKKEDERGRCWKFQTQTLDFVKLCTKTYQNKVQMKAAFVGNFLESLSSMSGRLLHQKKNFLLVLILALAKSISFLHNECNERLLR